MSGDRWRIVTLPLEKSDLDRLPPVPTYWQEFRTDVRFGLGCWGVVVVLMALACGLFWAFGALEIELVVIVAVALLLLFGGRALRFALSVPRSIRDRQAQRRSALSRGTKTRLVATITEARRAKEFKGGWVTIGKIDDRTYVVLASSTDSNPEFDWIGEHVTLDFLPDLLERPPITSHGQRINVTTRIDIKLGGPLVYFAGDVIVLHYRNTGTNRAPEPWPRVVDAELGDFRHEQIHSLFGGDGDTAAR